MAATLDDILIAINNMTASQRSSTGGFSSKNVGDNIFDRDDFDERIKKYKKVINGEEEQSRKEIKEKIIESENKILELEGEINDFLEERNRLIEERNLLLEKQKNGTITAAELDRLEDCTKKIDEYNGKLDEHNDTLKKSIDLHKELERTPTGFEKIIGYVGKATNGIKAIYNEANKLAEPWNRLDSAASKYARSVGMAGDAYKKFRDTSLRNIDQNGLSASSGLKPEEIINAQLNFVKATGRNVGVDNKAQSDVAHMAKLLGDGGLNFAASLDKFGLGMTDAAELTTEMFNEAAKSGISFEEYTNNVTKNLNIAQNYTFKNGIKGLESMAKKSTAIKLDMQQIASFAEKVSTVEGAVQTSAKLQVLGGPFAQLADPMGMLNEGLNDMEGLFDRVSKMVGGLGSFNKERGEVEVSSFNKRRIRAAAEAMGMDYGQLMESVNTQARRNEIGKQISSSASLSGLDEEMKELIKNTASFKDGKAGITTANGEFKALEGLSGEDAKALKEELQLQNQTKEQDIKSIVQSTKGAQEALEGLKAQIDARQASMFGWLGNFLKIIHTGVGTLSGILTAVVAIRTMNSVGSIADAFTGGKAKGKAGRKIGEFLENFGGSGNKAKGAANKIDDVADAVFDGKRWRNSKGQFIKAPKGAANAIPKGGNFLTRSFGRIKNVGGKALGGLKNIGGKTIGKIATKLGPKALGIAGKIGKAAVSGGGIGSIATVLGVAGNIATDALIEKGKIKKGSGAHHAMSAGSSALAGAGTGAMIGSFLGPIGAGLGAAIGGVIGAGIGLWKSGAIKQTVKKIKESKLGKAVSKKASEIKEKLENSKVGKAVNTFRQSKVGKAVGKVLEYGTPVGLMAKGIKALTDRNKLAKSVKPRTKSIDLLNQYTAKIKPVMEKGGVAAAAEVAKANSNIHIKTDPHDIKLNGTLNIKGENGQTIDLMKELNNNPRMMRQLADMLTNEMGVLKKGGYVAQGV